MTRGVKKGSVIRPKAPTAPSMDFPLCEIRDGTTEGTKWYIGEMLSKTGGVCKCWKLFDFKGCSPEDIEKMTVDDLEKLAWTLVSAARVRRNDSDEIKATLKTPEEDRAHYALLRAEGKDLPSKVARLAKQKKILASRRAKGLRSDGRRYAHAGLGRTISGQLARTPSDMARQFVFAKLERMIAEGSTKNGRPRADSGDSAASTDCPPSFPGSPGSGSSGFPSSDPSSPTGSVATAPAMDHHMQVDSLQQPQVAVQQQQPADYPVYYSPQDLLKHGLTVEDLCAAGLSAVSTTDGGAVLGNVAYLTVEEQTQLLGGPISPAAEAQAPVAEQQEFQFMAPVAPEVVSPQPDVLVVEEAAHRLEGLVC